MKFTFFLVQHIEETIHMINFEAATVLCRSENYETKLLREKIEIKKDMNVLINVSS